MRIESFDWTGKEWSSALVNTAKSKIDNPLLALCSPYLFNDLMQDGFSARQYSTQASYEAAMSTQHSPFPRLAIAEPCTYVEGDLAWQTVGGLPDDVLIVSNLDTVLTFHGFKSTHMERTTDQMPLYLAQRQKEVVDTPSLDT